LVPKGKNSRRDVKDDESVIMRRALLIIIRSASAGWRRSFERSFFPRFVVLEQRCVLVFEIFLQEHGTPPKM